MKRSSRQSLIDNFTTTASKVRFETVVKKPDALLQRPRPDTRGPRAALPIRRDRRGLLTLSHRHGRPRCRWCPILLSAQTRFSVALTRGIANAACETPRPNVGRRMAREARLAEPAGTSASAMIPIETPPESDERRPGCKRWCMGRQSGWIAATADRPAVRKKNRLTVTGNHHSNPHHVTGLRPRTLVDSGGQQTRKRNRRDREPPHTVITARLRRTQSSQNRARGGRYRSFPVPSGRHPLERDGSDPRLVGQARTTTSQPGWQ